MRRKKLPRNDETTKIFRNLSGGEGSMSSGDKKQEMFE